MRRILTFNCHEAWVHQLASLGLEVDVVDGLPGRYTASWDERMRPVPSCFRLLALEDALKEPRPYDCIVAHNLSDLLCVKALNAPRVLVLHVTLEHRLMQARITTPPDDFCATIRSYLARVGGHVVAVTEAKRRSWGLGGDVVEAGVDLASYPIATREVAAAVRVANQITARQQYLFWDFHKTAFADIPVRIVGYNPELPGVEASRDWADLKHILSRHRFFIHTADPQLEDGFNMALMEAAATGLPLLGNRHPTSPVEHGVHGFLSDDPEELGRLGRRLLDEPELAATMGAAARDLAERRFSTVRFAHQFSHAMDRARDAWLRVAASKRSPG